MLTAAVTSPADWRYVSEGGATIVFSYAGPSHPQFDGTVLRLRKAAVAPLVDHMDYQKQPEEPDDPIIEFQQRCLQHLIPDKHLPRLRSVLLDHSWLQKMSELHDSARPQFRRSQGCIDVRKRKGVLATNLVGGNWVAVEIKPKWGFLPSPKHLSSETRSTKTQTCRFCMHSQLKSGVDEVPLGYCPLDLYSGDRRRMTKAIHALWDAWIQSTGSMNNLKVFVNGAQIHPSEAHLMFASFSPKLVDADMKNAFASALLPLLCDTPVLRILSQLQRDFDPLDIEGVSELWHQTEKLLRDKNPYSSPGDPSITIPASLLGVNSQFLSVSNPTMDDWDEFIHAYLNSSVKLDNDNPSPNNLRYYLLAYLLSTTFKDCSLILQLDYLNPKPVRDLHPHVGLSQVSVIDLDPKPMSRLHKWEKLDRDIVISYINSSRRTRCIDNGWKGERRSLEGVCRCVLYSVMLLIVLAVVFIASRVVVAYFNN
ncbi:hypothetical protein AX16_004786 [Volvariella volvacea WC 439]|nr:hypothetical protein AX16_004786 [Volvariella volvacea WC 439]